MDYVESIEAIVANEHRNGVVAQSDKGVDAGSVEFIDLAFNASGMAAVIEAIQSRPANSAFAYIVTPNVDHLVRLHDTRSDLWPAYRKAWMTLCDSRILARRARSNGFALPVLPGSDLTKLMFEQVIRAEDKVAVLGGNGAEINALAGRFGLQNIQHYNPPMGFIEKPFEVAKAMNFLVRAKPRYSFIALGSPQQEIIAYKMAHAGTAKGIGFCVGASLDFLTGEQVRAPVFMQQLALEWLYRLGSNPRRMWRRYLVDGPGIFPIERRWRRALLERRAVDASLKV
jgi:exopolysaccharide biosynthesis WecB/TagA/CpsF family protein